MSGKKSNVLIAAVFLAVALGAGCPANPANSPPDETGGPIAGSITVSAAASLAEPFNAIAGEFTASNPEVSRVKFNFDSSATLAGQIAGGAPADVFASADRANLERLESADLIELPAREFARNQLAIIVKKGNPLKVQSLVDLAALPIVALGGPEVPVGKYATEALKSAGVVIPQSKIAMAKDPKAVVVAVTEGDADAGIVYVTDIPGSSGESVPIPQDQNVTATYVIAATKDSRNLGTARAFVAHVMSEGGQSRLAAFGFLRPA